MTTPEATTAEQPKKQLDLNLDYFKTHAGQLRVAQGYAILHRLAFLFFCHMQIQSAVGEIKILSLSALISAVEGQCRNDIARYGFFLCVIIITMLEAILIISAFVLKQDKKLTAVNMPLTLLMNDSIILIFHFINCTLSMLSINRCHYKIEARVIATLFAIALFLTYIGLIYTDYKWWERDNSSKETNGGTNGSTTVTESSPTVLT